jgi:hypothetical protein
MMFKIICAKCKKEMGESKIPSIGKDYRNGLCLDCKNEVFGKDFSQYLPK